MNKKELEYQDIALYLPDLRVKIKPELIESLEWTRPKYRDLREYDELEITGVEFYKEGPRLSLCHLVKEFTEELMLSDVRPVLHEWWNWRDSGLDLLKLAKTLTNNDDSYLMNVSPTNDMSITIIKPTGEKCSLDFGLCTIIPEKSEWGFLDNIGDLVPFTFESYKLLAEFQIDCNDLIGQGLAVNKNER